MILLDTNVVSEAMRPWPEPGVIRWLDALPASEVWISAVTVAEIRLAWISALVFGPNTAKII